jgi:hypothetical protein
MSADPLRWLLTMRFAILRLAGLLWSSSATAQAIWENIKSSGKRRFCVVKAGAPYSEKDAEGRWQGLMVDVGGTL